MQIIRYHHSKHDHVQHSTDLLGCSEHGSPVVPLVHSTRPDHQSRHTSAAPPSLALTQPTRASTN